jgi:hypothetical protein
MSVERKIPSMLRNPERCVTILALALMLFVPFSGLPLTVAASPPTGVIVLLYFTAGSQWDGVIQAKIAHPAVPIVGIINPANGPGGQSDASYAALTQKLQSAGVVVLGYVYTSYGSRDSSAVKADINNYAGWYKVNGVFLDEMAYWSGQETYYSNLTSYAWSIGLTLVLGNPGTDTVSSYVGSVDTIVIYENSGFPNPSSLGGWHAGYAKTNWAVLAYNVDSLAKSSVNSASNNVGYVYVTNGAYPYPWNSLPPYFADLVATLDSPPAQQCLTIQTAASNGDPIRGLWTAIQSGGGVVATGFSPLTYAVTPGTEYTVSVADYQNYVFNSWTDTGSTNRFRTISTSSDTTVTAVHLNYNGPPPSGESKISVNTVSSTGANIGGFYTTFWSNASILPGCSSPCSSKQGFLYSCFSPCSFFVPNGATYYVAVADYGGQSFNRWSDGTTSRYLTVTLANVSATVSTTAIYSP